MTVVLTLIAAAVVIGCAGPRLLRVVERPTVSPAAALAAWLGTVAAAVLLTAAAAALAVLPHLLETGPVRALVSECLSGSVSADSWSTAARMAVAAVPLLALARLAAVAVPAARAARRSRDRHLTVVRLLCSDAEGVHWLDEARPLAYSLGGRPGAVIATAGVRGLGERRCAAVLAHERAHIRGRHHLMLQGVDVVAAAFPFLPLARRAALMVRLLVELAADDAAARSHSPHTVRSALALMGGATPAPSVPGGLHMSNEAIAVRLARLDSARVRRGPRRGALASAAFSVTPAVVAAGMLTVGFHTACTLLL
ncbi:hypothetical protein AXK57_18620 [Tsukamurella pulmonis]|uniref:Peptidase family M48 n=2 Tax=Tsukamurella pulmonis TaxID=47312 RepID=A0A1H1HPC4_9ACTN|nr:M56 family metallopeptidase [Tsukamurella pulmonis]KXO94508.1 hypothetical protein AXK56_17845 [Tsukamurella pulmonis]KXP12322.1 hypothetical protein AXK57_18620 [Tsukamurella pulmonis]SDR27257.1 Peptidase family M48 [Tsukamurella pulmonis]SUP13746.1 Antirepressor regulating drug resistance, predicted signal transduction N-terminal membrane component [Tsukamurella pulmonis]